MNMKTKLFTLDPCLVNHKPSCITDPHKMARLILHISWYFPICNKIMQFSYTQLHQNLESYPHPTCFDEKFKLQNRINQSHLSFNCAGSNS